MATPKSTLDRRDAGDSGLQLPVLGMGCFAFGGGAYWGPTDQETADAVVHHAYELGINYFDTAEAYNDGRSEESLGLAMKDLPRDRLIIGTKISPSNAYPGQIVEHCEASMHRLGVDYIDLYMLHWPLNPVSLRNFTVDEQLISNPPRLEDVLMEMEDLRVAGKIRYFGVSNFGVPWLTRTRTFGVTPTINQLPYNLLAQAIEYEVMPYCRDHGIGIMGYSPLMQGLLSGAYPTFNDIPEMQRRTRHFSSARTPLIRHGEEGAELETAFALKEIRNIAKDLGLSMADIAIKWAIHNPAVTCIIAGMRSILKVDENIAATAVSLPEEAVIRLNEVTRPLKERLGNHIDMWESVENDRTV